LHRTATNQAVVKRLPDNTPIARIKLLAQKALAVPRPQLRLALHLPPVRAGHAATSVRRARCANEGVLALWQDATAASQEPPTPLDDSRDLAYYGVTAAAGVTAATIIVDYDTDTL